MPQIPADPIILYSYLNTLLRDKYASLSALCEDMELSEKELSEKLSAAGFSYDALRNRFI